ncbi:MAG: transcription antitermination factor NusB, partial [Phycisphaeraceae bacterium]
KGNALWGDERDNEGHEGQTTRPAALPVPAAPPEPPAPPAPTPAVWCSFLLALLLTLPSWLALAPAAVASFALPLIAHYHAPPMARRQDIRRLAMQVLYQIDLRGEADVHAIRQAPADEHDDEATHQAGLTLALAAWDHHVDADTLAAELAPDWPTYRQPPVDRAILRLAYHEMVSGYAPPKVAINEAIELSKHYSSELSPPFINGVLDKMAKRLAAEKRIPEAQSLQEPPTSDQWLAEALGSTAKSKAKSEKLQADDHQHTPERPPDSSAADA